jgi:hypothetical protein
VVKSAEKKGHHQAAENDEKNIYADAPTGAEALFV